MIAPLPQSDERQPLLSSTTAATAATEAGLKRSAWYRARRSPLAVACVVAMALFTDMVNKPLLDPFFVDPNQRPFIPWKTHCARGIHTLLLRAFVKKERERERERETGESRNRRNQQEESVKEKKKKRETPKIRCSRTFYFVRSFLFVFVE